MTRFTALRLTTLIVALTVLTLPAVVIAQPQCLISAAHRTDDWSSSSLGNNILTVDEGGNWVLTLTFRCTGITNLSTHDPSIFLTDLTVDSKPLWISANNGRFKGDIWNQDGFGPTNFGGTDPAGDFTARVHVSGTSVDNNCHDSGTQTEMTFAAQIQNTAAGGTNMAERNFTVRARDDDPLSITLSPGEPWEVTINNWKVPCS